MKKGNIKFVLIMIAVLSTIAFGVQAQGQTFYVAAESGFKLKGPLGFDEYLWAENNVTIPAATGSSLSVTALGASTVGNVAVSKTYTLKVKSNAGCWSDEGSYTIHILPKLVATTSGYTPPYCENLSQQITLTANINGASGATALTLVPNVSVGYQWSVVAGAAPLGNAAIVGNSNQVSALVMTPQNTLVDNEYKVIATYILPAATNITTDVIGSITAQTTQNIHADPKPSIPVIQVEEL